MLGLAGGLAGLLLDYGALQGVRLVARESLHLWQELKLDGRVIGVAFGGSVVASLLFGLLPALSIGRTDVRAAIDGAGARTTGHERSWARSALVIGEVALGLVLLVSAGLLLRTFAALRALHPGFEAKGVITAQISLQDSRYNTTAKVNGLFTEGLARIRALPGVTAAAIGLGLPYERHLRLGIQFLDGAEAKGPGGNATATYVTPDYFAALRIPLLRGRLLRESDGPRTQKVALVTDAFVHRYLEREQPLGRHIRLAGTPLEIVGVVGDVLEQTGGSRFGPIAALPAVFFPVAQADDQMLELVHTWFSPSWLVRVEGPPERTKAGIASAVEAIDPRLPIARFRDMKQVEADAVAQQRIQAILLVILAAPALFLAALGIYGLIAHSVVARTREVGIRLALGATRWKTMRAIALPGIVLSLAGVLLGSVLARGAVQALQHLVWGVRPTDPSTFVAVALGLLIVAAVASILPTVRLARLSPACTLREE